MDIETEKQNPTLNLIETFIREMIEGLHPLGTDPVGAGRPRILLAVCLWAGVLVCVLRGWSSQLAVWRLLSEKNLWHYPRFPVSDQAVYKRLEQGGRRFGYKSRQRSQFGLVVFACLMFPRFIEMIRNKLIFGVRLKKHKMQRVYCHAT